MAAPSTPQPKTRVPRVFMLYALADHAKAMTIRRRMLEHLSDSISFVPYEFMPSEGPGEPAAARLNRDILASDYVIILLSPASLTSPWVQWEQGRALFNDWAQRDITVILVLVAECEIPRYLRQYVTIDLTRDFDAGIATLLDTLQLIPELDLSTISGPGLVNLTAALLGKLGFSLRDESLPKTRAVDEAWDLVARYTRPDPFGGEVQETWMVECKAYSSGRVSVDTLRQLAMRLAKRPLEFHGLVVTNGLLTSVARKALNDLVENSRVDLRVIDSAQFKALLFAHPDLLQDYRAAQRW